MTILSEEGKRSHLFDRNLLANELAAFDDLFSSDDEEENEDENCSQNKATRSPSQQSLGQILEIESMISGSKRRPSFGERELYVDPDVQIMALELEIAAASTTGKSKYDKRQRYSGDLENIFMKKMNDESRKKFDDSMMDQKQRSTSWTELEYSGSGHGRRTRRFAHVSTATKDNRDDYQVPIPLLRRSKPSSSSQRRQRTTGRIYRLQSQRSTTSPSYGHSFGHRSAPTLAKSDTHTTHISTTIPVIHFENKDVTDDFSSSRPRHPVHRLSRSRCSRSPKKSVSISISITGVATTNVTPHASRTTTTTTPTAARRPRPSKLAIRNYQHLQMLEF